MDFGKLEFTDACLWLCNTYGISVPANVKKPVRKLTLMKHKVSTIVSEKFFDYEIANWVLDNSGLDDIAKHFLFDVRKLDSSVIERLKIVSISKPNEFVSTIVDKFGKERVLKSGLVKESMNPCFWTPCLVFPYFDIYSNLVGVQMRYLGNNEKAPRFQFISGQSSRLFNAPILNEIGGSDKLYITEGVTDCLAMLSEGKKAIAIPSATIIPVNDLIYLQGYTLNMYPDNDKDEAGIKGYLKLKNSLLEVGGSIFRHNLPKKFKDYSDYYVFRKSSIN